jgi:site-specific DNA-methyltransferase (adenine-specific)
MELNKIYNEDCLIGIKRIHDNSVDCILTDPPYLYLKNQKLDRPFDEQALFSEFKRVLKPTGFVVMFGRGTSFYRWNTVLASLGFEFKEEIIWNKSYCSSPLMALSRVHETVSIHSRKGVINKVKVPYLEMKGHDLDAIKTDISRLLTTYSNPDSLIAVKRYIESGELTFDGEYNAGVTITSGRKRVNRCVSTINTIQEGMNEKDIIRIRRDHYNTIHPTQKPVRLLERLLALTTQPGDVVLDPFMGSCSTAIACVNTNREYIGFEIDSEYYAAGVKRLNEVLSAPKLAM